MEGSKQSLIEAVRAGFPVRLYMRGRRVEHAADAGFLTILDGEVFAQIEAIRGQTPSVDPPAVALRDDGLRWQAIYSTTGARSSAVGDGAAQEGRSSVRWYVLR